MRGREESIVAIVALFASALLPAAASADPGAGAAPRSISAPSRAVGATVGRLVTPVRARLRLDRPRPSRRVSVQTSWSGQPTTLLVLDSKTYRGREWLEVLLPDRPNGTSGWVPRERLVLHRIPYWIEVSTGRRTVSVYRRGRLVRRFRAVVGAPSTPTPRGLAAVYERNRQPDPSAFLGTWVLALTIQSNVLKRFEGGTGRVGIHGRSGASLRDPLGSARSHGCIRIGNGPVSWVAAHVRAGTPVRLRR